MQYIVYGAEFCPRCDKAAAMLSGFGHTVVKREMEQIIDPASWSTDCDEAVEVMADHAMRNMELPSIRCTETGEWFDYDELVEEA